MIDSNTPKIPTLLAVAGLAVALLLSFALNPTPAFADSPRLGGKHPHGGDDGDKVTGTYNVTVTGDLDSIQIVEKPFDAWPAVDGNKSTNVILGYTPDDTSSLSDRGPLELMGLSSLISTDPDIGVFDEDCFDLVADDWLNTSTYMTISQKKDGSAFVMYTFTGWSVDGMKTEILYQFHMFGDGLDAFFGDWRPTVENPTTTVFLTDWEMRMQGGAKDIACTGSGDFIDQTIEVTRRPDGQ